MSIRNVFLQFAKQAFRVSRLCRCKTDPFAFPQPPRPPISPEKSLIPSSGFQPPSNRSRRSPRSTPRPRPLVVCTRKRRGDGKHVCAMRTGIGVSLFRGGSDVLFHPRRRQSCRTAKTYHTIVSKFAHSLISLAHSSLSSFLFLSLPSFTMSPAALYISLSCLVLPYRFLLLVLYVFFYFASFTIYRRDFISRTPSVWKGLVVRASKVFRLRAGLEKHRVKCASCHLRLSE